MKILQICSAREIGGGERHVADLANSLAARGHDVFAALQPASPLISHLHNVSRERIVEVKTRNALDPFAGRRLARVVRDNQIDLIHAHIARDYPLTAMASRLSASTPFVLTRHVLFGLNRLHRVLLRNCSRIIAVSSAVAGSIEQRQIVDPNRIATIYNGIDTERFTPQGAKDRPESLNGVTAPFLVGMIGHIAPIKGQGDLIQAAAITNRPDVGFVLVGEDKSRSGENRRAIDHLIRKHDLSDKVHIVNWQDDVRPLLRSFDIFVSPSRVEPFGLVIIEAMASGAPVIATRSKGAREIIEDGRTGILVPVSEPNVLSEAIGNLLDDPALRERLANAARQTVETRFSLDKMVDATEQVYYEAVARR